MLARLYITDLPNDVTAVQAVALEQNRIACEFWQQIELLKYQIAQFTRAHFGASSEQLPGQGDLFADTVTTPEPAPAPTLDTRVAGHVRRGWPALPKDLPRERIEYDLPETEKAQFDHLERIGEEVSETLDYTPAKLTLVEHVRITSTPAAKTASRPSAAPRSRSHRHCRSQMPVLDCWRKLA